MKGMLTNHYSIIIEERNVMKKFISIIKENKIEVFALFAIILFFMLSW